MGGGREPPGHRATRHGRDDGRGDGPHWAYRDAASMALQVMEALGVARAYALGRSAGGLDRDADGAFGARESMDRLRPDQPGCGKGQGYRY